MKSREHLKGEALNRARHISENLCAGFDIAMLTLESKMPFKALVLREVLAHRFADLGLSASELLDSGRVVSSATLTRAAMETLARVAELSDRIEGFLTAKNLEELDDYLMTSLFGSRNDPDLPQARNILGSIDRMENKIPGYRTSYENLCEFAHPNWSGAMGAFAETDRENFKVSFDSLSRRQKAQRSVGLALNATLGAFLLFYNESADAVGALNTHFERGIATSATA